ncbi:MAG: FAD-dependent oxidoreductase [bacterium]|nr:FAD-dependent oxidoreductase [bacterium]
MEATVIKITPDTKHISSFRFTPVQKMAFQPGQWMYVRLSESLKHHFTISSSPTEDFLQITTMLRPESEYKQALFALKEGDKVDINGPFGSFVLDSGDQTPRLFVAGGIGITPFRCMAKFTADKKLAHDLVLLYSVKSVAEAAFASELTDLAAQNHNFKIKVIESSQEGRLDEEKIKKYCPDWQNRSMWICGPPAMVEAFTGLAQQLGLPADKIKSEEFTGYA